MLQIRNLSNALQKRLIRPLYAHTQATPWGAVLDASLRNADGSFRAPLNGDASPTRTANAFVYQGGLVPGTVMIKGAGEAMKVHNGATGIRPVGLLANFVGGTLDDLKDENNIGVWYGPGSQFELLAPAFNDAGLAAAYSAATPGVPVLLYAGVDGRLCCSGSLTANGGLPAVTTETPVAELVERSGPGKIVVKLLV